MSLIPIIKKVSPQSFPSEARNVALLNSQDSTGIGQGARFLLGGTTVHNSNSFLDMIQDAAARLPPSIARPPPTSNSAGPSLNLSIGPVQLAVGRGNATPAGANNPANDGVGTVLGGAGGLLDPGRVGEAAEGARDLAQGLFGRLRGAVDQIALPQ